MPELSGEQVPEQKLEEGNEDLMRMRGKALLEYLNTPEKDGGPGPATDDETARPSPFRGLKGFKSDVEEVE